MRAKPGNVIKYLIIVCCILVLLAGCSRDTGYSRDIEVNERVESFSTHPVFISERQLHSILAERTEKTSSVKGRVVSAVVPHHLVAGHLIVEAVQTLVPQQPDVVILIGPNHYNRGGRIITGFNSWQTPSGLVNVKKDIVSYLLDNGLAVRDEQTLSQEHSVGAVVPFIKYFLPDTTTVPLILHYDVTLEEINTLLYALEHHLNERTVVISSVDFSHYLTRSQAQLKDKETLMHMENFDYTTLFSLGNDHLDSPASLAAAFRLAEMQGIKEFTVLDNTNSGIIMQNDFIETTSYFTLIFVDN